MKIIDKTPLIDEKGELGIVQRVQGMLQFGFNWPTDLAAQKAIVTFLDRQLEKGYTLIRNLTLGQSGIKVPIILLGPAGVFAIYITNLRGMYQVKEGEWGTVNNGRFQPAKVNLIQDTMRMARAVQVFIERQGVKMPPNYKVEPVLIAANPGMHLELSRPAIKVVKIDGVKPFAASLLSAAPKLTNETVYEYTERLIDPRPPKSEQHEPVAPVPEPRAKWEEMYEEPAPPPPSRSKAIFDASQEAKPFNAADFDFALADEEPTSQAAIPNQVAAPIASQPRPKPKSSRIFGMTVMQVAILGALVLVLICIGIAFAYVYFTMPH